MRTREVIRDATKYIAADLRVASLLSKS